MLEHVDFYCTHLLDLVPEIFGYLVVTFAVTEKYIRHCVGSFPWVVGGFSAGSVGSMLTRGISHSLPIFRAPGISPRWQSLRTVSGVFCKMTAACSGV